MICYSSETKALIVVSTSYDSQWSCALFAHVFFYRNSFVILSANALKGQLHSHIHFLCPTEAFVEYCLISYQKFAVLQKESNILNWIPTLKVRGFANILIANLFLNAVLIF